MTRTDLAGLRGSCLRGRIADRVTLETVFRLCKICGSGELERWSLASDLVACRNCDFVFASRIYGPSELQDTYRHLYSENGGYRAKLRALEKLRAGEAVGLGWNKRIVLRRLKTLHPGRVLELGAGVGVVARYLSNRPVEYLGVEFEQNIAREAALLGLDIVAGDYKTAAEITGARSLDAVLAFEVLEHVQDIGDCLRSLNRLMKTEGVLGFSVPNLRACENYRPPRLGQYGPPVHLNFWTQGSLEKTLAFFGFRPLMMRERPLPIRSGDHWNDVKRVVTAVMRRYHGPTLACVAQKMHEA